LFGCYHFLMNKDVYINEIQMTCKEHCHTTDTYLQIFFFFFFLYDTPVI